MIVPRLKRGKRLEGIGNLRGQERRRLLPGSQKQRDYTPLATIIPLKT
jgi:hypothetical protein